MWPALPASTSAARAGPRPPSPRTSRGALGAGLHAPLRRARGRTLDLRCRPDQLALPDHAVVRLARALDLIEELAVVIRQLAHDLIFGGGRGSLVKSGNEVDFLANAEFVITHTGRTNKRIDPPPYLVSLKLPRPINVLRCGLSRWLRLRAARSNTRNPRLFGGSNAYLDETGSIPFCAVQHPPPERLGGR